MDFLNTPLLAGLGERLRFLTARTSVIAENIANADTPGFVARDISKADFRVLATKEAMRITDPRHMQASSASASQGSSLSGAGRVSVRPQAAPDGEAAINGNQVSVETQMMKMSETRMEYQLASSVYRKGLNMIRLAARGGGSG